MKGSKMNAGFAPRTASAFALATAVSFRTVTVHVSPNTHDDDAVTWKVYEWRAFLFPQPLGSVELRGAERWASCPATLAARSRG